MAASPSISLSVTNAARSLKLQSALSASLTLREEVYVADMSLQAQSSALHAANLTTQLALAPALRGEQGPPGRIGTVTASAFEVPPGQPPVVQVVQNDDGVDLTLGIPAANNARAVVNASPFTLQAGQPVTVVSGGAVVPSQSNSDLLFNVAGIVSSASIPPGETGFILVNGIVKLATTVLWDQVVIGGSGGLVPNQTYFLDWTVPGKLNPDFPLVTGYYRVPLGIALSSTELEIQLGYNIKL